VAPNHSVALFSSASKTTDFPGWLSRIIDLPVTANDGLSHYICRPCNRKFVAAESFRSSAKRSYERKGFHVSVSVSLQSSPKVPPVATSRKRVKDTSGIDASPHTSRARPLAKRSTTGVPGRRLAFPAQENCKINRLLLFILWKIFNLGLYI